MGNSAKRIFASAIVIPLMALLALALPAIALAGNVPAQRVGRVLFTINIETNDPATSGPFSATGKAFDKGIVCPSGTILDTAKAITSWKNGKGIDVEGVRVFTCTDGSGSFTMSFLAHVRLDPSYKVWGKWQIVDGTFDYVNLFGRGRLTTILIDPVTLEAIDYFKGTIGIVD